jgi:hypothetical protein
MVDRSTTSANDYLRPQVGASSSHRATHRNEKPDSHTFKEAKERLGSWWSVVGSDRRIFYGMHVVDIRWTGHDDLGCRFVL